MVPHQPEHSGLWPTGKYQTSHRAFLKSRPSEFPIYFSAGEGNRLALGCVTLLTQRHRYTQKARMLPEWHKQRQYRDFLFAALILRAAQIEHQMYIVGIIFVAPAAGPPGYWTVFSNSVLTPIIDVVPGASPVSGLISVFPFDWACSSVTISGASVASYLLPF